MVASCKCRVQGRSRDTDFNWSRSRHFHLHKYPSFIPPYLLATINLFSLSIKHYLKYITYNLRFFGESEITFQDIFILFRAHLAGKSRENMCSPLFQKWNSQSQGYFEDTFLRMSTYNISLLFFLIVGQIKIIYLANGLVILFCVI